MKTTGRRMYQTGQAGQFFVAAELNRQGAFAVTFAGNMPRIDLLASNTNQTRTVQIQVKSRRAGDWQVRASDGKNCRAPKDETGFWVFVDLVKKRYPEPPDYYIVPETWMRRDIWKHHQAYLNKYGGQRKISQKSDHHSVNLKRIEQWKDHWDILKIF